MYATRFVGMLACNGFNVAKNIYIMTFAMLCERVNYM